METEDLNERMLQAWLRLTTVISNERVAKAMPYKEALICHILDQEAGSGPLTATDLCEKTKMLKSQMNRTLNSMEKKGLIVRKRSESDHRKVYISLSPSNRPLFEEEHQKNLQLVDTILDRFGRERGEMLAEEFDEISEIAEEVFL